MNATTNANATETETETIVNVWEQPGHSIRNAGRAQVIASVESATDIFIMTMMNDEMGDYMPIERQAMIDLIDFQEKRNQRRGGKPIRYRLTQYVDGFSLFIG